MERKRIAKETQENIISIATKLFLEKGYEKTSVQDIANTLGMTRGAVFHHFKSKEDILNEVINRQAEYAEQVFYKWLEEMEGLPARKKIMLLLEKSLKDRDTHALDSIIADQVKNPHFVVAAMQNSINRNAPILAKLLKEGIKDGSIKTDYPDECAEVFFVLLDVWCDPVLFECNADRLNRRLAFLQKLTKQIGVNVFDDNFIKAYSKLVLKIYRRSSK